MPSVFWIPKVENHCFRRKDVNFKFQSYFWNVWDFVIWWLYVRSEPARLYLCLFLKRFVFKTVLLYKSLPMVRSMFGKDRKSLQFSPNLQNIEVAWVLKIIYLCSVCSAKTISWLLKPALFNYCFFTALSNLDTCIDSSFTRKIQDEVLLQFNFIHFGDSKGSVSTHMWR